MYFLTKDEAIASGLRYTSTDKDALIFSNFSSNQCECVKYIDFFSGRAGNLASKYCSPFGIFKAFHVPAKNRNTRCCLQETILRTLK